MGHVIVEKGDKIAGFIFEPIQGEAGVSSLEIESYTVFCF